MNKLDYREYQKLIGERIKQYRINAGISQKDLENESGVSVLAYPDWNKGHRFNLRV